MTSDNKTKLVSSSFIILQGIIYGICSPITKIAYEIVPVNLFLAFRYLISVVFLLLIFGRTIVPEMRSTPIKFYILPAICLSLSSLLSNISLHYAEATCAVFLRSLGAIFVPLLALIFYGKKYTKRTFFLQLAIIVGMYLICMREGGFSFGKGEALALLSAILVAGSLVFSGTSLHHVGAKTLSFAQLVCALIISSACALANGDITSETVPQLGNTQVLLILLFAGIISSAFGHLCQNLALKNISSRLVGVLQCLHPVFTMLFSYFIIAERLTPVQLIGAAILFVCIEIEASGKAEKD